MKAVFSSFLSRLCPTEVVLRSVSPPMDQQFSSYFCCSLLPALIPESLVSCLRCCGIALSWGRCVLSFCAMIVIIVYEFTPEPIPYIYLHLGSLIQIFNLCSLFFSHLRTVSWIFCSFVLNTGHVHLFLWRERPLTEARGCATVLSPLGFPQMLTSDRGCIPVCVHCTLSSSLLSTRHMCLSSSVCCLLS